MASKPQRVPRRQATVWACGDEVCDCSQAIVEDVLPHPNFPAGPWVKRERVAEGPFYTDGEGWWNRRVHVDAEYLASIYGVEVA